MQPDDSTRADWDVTGKRRDGRSSELPVTSQFARVYQEHAAQILRFCRVRIENPADAEDAAAQVFARALAAFPPDDPEKMRQWLFAIAHNVVANHYRSTSARAPVRPWDEALGAADTRPAPDEITLQQEERETLLQAIAKLTPDQRQVVELRLSGLTGIEIAEATGRSHDAVKMLQYRAIRNLRSLLMFAEQGPVVIPGSSTKEINDGN